ncbi:synaptonemal complex protein 1-like [Centruroides vittatus]|uniref:synaptonemal complex protein 1-like n=1 Tax=Centruroides vittatus TaxID=120091 RepID=UPI00350FD2D2
MRKNKSVVVKFYKWLRKQKNTVAKESSVINKRFTKRKTSKKFKLQTSSGNSNFKTTNKGKVKKTYSDSPKFHTESSSNYYFDSEDNGLIMKIKSSSKDENVAESNITEKFSNIEKSLTDSVKISKNGTCNFPTQILIAENEYPVETATNLDDFQYFLGKITDMTLCDILQRFKKMQSDEDVIQEVYEAIRQTLIIHLSQQKQVSTGIKDILQNLTIDTEMLETIQNAAKNVLINRLIQEEKSTVDVQTVTAINEPLIKQQMRSESTITIINQKEGDKAKIKQESFLVPLKDVDIEVTLCDRPKTISQHEPYFSVPVVAPKNKKELIIEDIILEPKQVQILEMPTKIKDYEHKNRIQDYEHDTSRDNFLQNIISDKKITNSIGKSHSFQRIEAADFNLECDIANGFQTIPLQSPSPVVNETENINGAETKESHDSLNENIKPFLEEQLDRSDESIKISDMHIIKKSNKDIPTELHSLSMTESISEKDKENQLIIISTPEVISPNDIDDIKNESIKQFIIHKSKKRNIPYPFFKLPAEEENLNGSVKSDTDKQLTEFDELSGQHEGEENEKIISSFKDLEDYNNNEEYDTEKNNLTEISIYPDSYYIQDIESTEELPVPTTPTNIVSPAISKQSSTLLPAVGSEEKLLETNDINLKIVSVVPTSNKSTVHISTAEVSQECIKESVVIQSPIAQNYVNRKYATIKSSVSNINSIFVSETEVLQSTISKQNIETNQLLRYQTLNSIKEDIKIPSLQQSLKKESTINEDKISKNIQYMDSKQEIIPVFRTKVPEEFRCKLASLLSQKGTIGRCESSISVTNYNDSEYGFSVSFIKKNDDNNNRNEENVYFQREEVAAMSNARRKCIQASKLEMLNENQPIKYEETPDELHKNFENNKNKCQIKKRNRVSNNKLHVEGIKLNDQYNTNSKRISSSVQMKAVKTVESLRYFHDKVSENISKIPNIKRDHSTNKGLKSKQNFMIKKKTPYIIEKSIKKFTFDEAMQQRKNQSPHKNSDPRHNIKESKLNLYPKDEYKHANLYVNSKAKKFDKSKSESSRWLPYMVQKCHHWRNIAFQSDENESVQKERNCDNCEYLRQINQQTKINKQNEKVIQTNTIIYPSISKNGVLRSDKDKTDYPAKNIKRVTFSDKEKRMKEIEESKSFLDPILNLGMKFIQTLDNIRN